MSREQKILLWLLLGGTSLICLAFGETFFEELIEYRDRDTARWSFAVVGFVLLAAAFVLREVFKTRSK